MKFPSAQKGVYKLWIAALIGIIVTAIAFVGSILSGFADGNEGLKTATAGVVGVGGIAGLIVLILELVGLHQASQDESKFHSAFLIIILGLALGVLAGIIGAFKNDVCAAIASYVSIASSVCSLVALEYTFKGIMSLADQLGEKEMVQKGRKLIVIIWVVFIASIVLSLVSKILNPNAADWVKLMVSIFAIVAAAAEIVVQVITFLYYNTAKEMLKK